jgi:hypothetical protein
MHDEKRIRSVMFILLICKAGGSCWMLGLSYHSIECPFAPFQQITYSKEARQSIFSPRLVRLGKERIANFGSIVNAMSHEIRSCIP